MQIGEYSFTSNERKILEQISFEMIESLTRIGDKGHLEFEDLKEEYEVTDFDIMVQITDNILSMEKLKDNPEHLKTLRPIELTIAKLVILDILPRDEHTIAKRKLLDKINHILILKTINEN